MTVLSKYLLRRDFRAVWVCCVLLRVGSKEPMREAQAEKAEREKE